MPLKLCTSDTGPDSAKGKGRNVDLDFPLDDFFMSLALLATTRSRIKEQVCIIVCVSYYTLLAMCDNCCFHIRIELVPVWSTMILGVP